jgi:2-polyprenyl-3-methyl-5-hydroxy-6-metoxy-1,4-benzoquinol methylase
MDRNRLVTLLARAATEYPRDMVDAQVRDIPRIVFNIGIALEAAKPKKPSELAICDLGGGIGLFSIGCGALGLRRTVLIDDFDDSINHRVGDAILALHRSYGVEVVSRNVVATGISDLDEDFDVISTFDSMEHWHHSPRSLFRGVFEKLKPGGIFVLGVPNCVNMRKRITVPFGFGKWSSMQDWYNANVFRGHVREPDVDDLKYIARDMGLCRVRILGRNWLGYCSRSIVIRIATSIFDHPLRLFPSLCSDLYMVGEKPKSGREPAEIPLRLASGSVPV